MFVCARARVCKCLQCKKMNTIYVLPFILNYITNTVWPRCVMVKSAELEAREFELQSC